MIEYLVLGAVALLFFGVVFLIGIVALCKLIFRRKLAKAHHWRAGNTIVLSHPGCHLSYHHPPEDILKKIEASVNDRRLTVLVTHWWEYFPNNQPNDRFIQALHETSEYLARRKDVKVVSFEEVAQGQTPLA